MTLSEETALVEDAVRQHEEALAVLCQVEWRQGRTNPCNLYARTGGTDWKRDAAIGSMTVTALAARAVQAHNESLAARTGDDGGRG